MSTSNKKTTREINKNLIEANVTSSLLLTYLAEAESLFPKALAAARPAKFPWLNIIRTTDQILNNIKKDFDIYKEAAVLGEEIDSLEGKLKKSIQKLNADGYALPVLDTPFQATHGVCASRKYKWPKVSQYKTAAEHRQRLIEKAIEQERKEIAEITLSALRAAKPAVGPAKTSKTIQRPAFQAGNKNPRPAEQGRY